MSDAATQTPQHILRAVFTEASAQVETANETERFFLEDPDGGLTVDAHYDQDLIVVFLWRADKTLLECVRMDCSELTEPDDLDELRDDMQGFCDLVENWRFIDKPGTLEFHHRTNETVFIEVLVNDPETDRTRNRLCTVTPDGKIDDVRHFDFLFEADRIAANEGLFLNKQVNNGP